MSQIQNSQQQVHRYGQDLVASAAATDERVKFIRNTYLHLAGAIGVFVLIETMIFALFGDKMDEILRPMLGGRFSWFLVLAVFMVVSFIADKWARSDASRAMQYAGLALYTVAEALIFVPLLWLATGYEGALQSAAIVTCVIFGGLTGTVLFTKADFSFLRYALGIVGFAALAVVVCAIFIGFNLGVWFSIAMVVFASGCILYSTSKILHHYRTDQYVAASLALFSSLALLFWYVLQLFMSRE